MLFNIIVIFLCSFIGGVSVFFIKNISQKYFKFILSFSGAYLFSITVIHILPELFHDNEKPMLSGVFVLIGFLFQVFLNFFSKGIEHGHMPNQDHGHHHHLDNSSFFLFLSLLIHSILEGSLLVHPHAMHAKSDVGNILFGLATHKIPESLALGTILITTIQKKWVAFLMIFIYTLASPIGLFLGNILLDNPLINHTWFDILFAIIAGNFLHISTTIFF